MSSPKWEIVGFQNAAISEKIITAAAKLFSDNYGLWGPLAAAKLKRSITQGARVRMSPKKLKEAILEHATLDSNNRAKNLCFQLFISRDLIGSVFATSWCIQEKDILWITQLCVRSDYRNQGIATVLLRELYKTGSYWAAGILSSHPFAIAAALRVFGRGSGLDINFQREHAHSIMESCPVEYVRSAKVLAGGHCADTQFWVDHTEPKEALRVMGERHNWVLGDLPEGCEYLALIKC